MSHWTLFDLFCGTGGFSYGMERSGLGYRTRFGIDSLPTVVRTFKRNHPLAQVLAADIRKVRRSEVEALTGVKRGKLDVIVGGPPCQGFSSIRPFRSVNDDDPRNSLFEQYASFVNYFRPKVFVLENVVGLATHKNGSTVALMEESFHSLGYDTQWRLLNAANFGVPQKRERLIMIGAERGSRIEFPQPTHDFSGSIIGFRDKSKILATPGRDLFSDRSLNPCVTVMDAIGDLPAIEAGDQGSEYASAPINGYQRARRHGKPRLTHHTATAHSKRMLEIISHSGKNIECIPKNLISSGFSSCYSRLDADHPSVTLTVNFVHPASNRCIHPVQHRALTPREGARLQSFDDRFEFEGNRTQVVKQIGNAVPPVLGTAIASAVAKML